MSTDRGTDGFTLAEVLVAIAVIFILTSVVLLSGSEYRAKARDVQRLSDLQQIQLALRAYAEQYGEYPCEVVTNCSSPVQTTSANGQIGVGGHIDTLLAPFLPTIPVDPRQDGTTYYYYIDPRQRCGGHPDQIVIFARTMETEQFRNADDTKCSSWGVEGGAGKPETHMIVIGQSSDV